MQVVVTDVVRKPYKKPFLHNIAPNCRVLQGFFPVEIESEEVPSCGLEQSAYHKQEVKGAANDIKPGILQPKEMEILPPQAGGLLRGRVGCRAAKLATTSRTPCASALQMPGTHLACKQQMHVRDTNSRCIRSIAQMHFAKKW